MFSDHTYLISFFLFVSTLVDDVFYFLRPKEGITDSVDLRKAQNNPLQSL